MQHRTRRFLSLGFAVVLFAALFSSTDAFAQKKDKAKQEKKETKTKAELLFNGKDLKGWHNYGKAGQPVKEQWVVDEGAIHLSNRGGGDIVTDAEYENFELQLEWKISEAGNSGIFYLVNEDTAKYKAIWHTAPEYQVLDDDKHPDGKYESHRAGANYDLIVPKPGNTKPVGEWNKTRLVVNKGKVEHWLNDVLVVSYELWTPEWEAMVAKSKFKSREGYGRSRKGRIGLQDHGDKVWFRNLSITRL